jgi:alkylhydroperoxidase/carboxymuconolactone decarboxylase family protein YurZ
MTDDQERRKDEIRRRTIETRGYWNPGWDAMLELSPEFTAAYVEFSGIPWTQGVLEPKVKELIYIAIDASTTHLHLPGLRNHIAAALRAGATKEEIIEVLQLTSVLGIHTSTMGMPILAEELTRFEADEAGEE